MKAEGKKVEIFETSSFKCAKCFIFEYHHRVNIYENTLNIQLFPLPLSLSYFLFGASMFVLESTRGVIGVLWRRETFVCVL